jgi:high-affinity nickel permease
VSEHSAVLIIVVLLVMFALGDAWDRFPTVRHIPNPITRTVLITLWILWVTALIYLIRIAWGA